MATLFGYLDGLAAIVGSDAVAAAKRQAGPIQERLQADLDNLTRWDSLAGRKEGGSAGRLRYGALCQLTAHAADGTVTQAAVRHVFLLAALDRLGLAWGRDSEAVPMAEIFAADEAADRAYEAAE